MLRSRAPLSSGFLAMFLCGGVVTACSGSGAVSNIDTGVDAAAGFDAATGADAKGGDVPDAASPDATIGVGHGDDDDGGPPVLDGGGLDSGCAATSTKVQQPLDIYIMLDQSASMDETVAGGGTKWSAITGALQQFVNSQVNGVSVGMQYFGLPTGGTPACPVTCTTDADCGPTGGPCLANACVGCSSSGSDS